MFLSIVLLILAGLGIAIFPTIKDGISNRKDKVGWTPWHSVGWGGRDIPLVLILLHLIFINGLIFIPVVLILIRAYHNAMYYWTCDNVDKFYGPSEMSEWFKKLRKLWSWIPVVLDPILEKIKDIFFKILTYFNKKNT